MILNLERIKGCRKEFVPNSLVINFQLAVQSVDDTICQ
jgi:hypothetical protein